VLAVQATGKGKSLCMQTAKTLLGSVTLVIVPLLALGAPDQVTKILWVNQLYGVVKGYYLDEIKTPEQRNMESLVVMADVDL
jgi:superfamily II DNA helicase RecQ